MNPKTLALTDRRCEHPGCRLIMRIEDCSQGGALTLLVCADGHQLLIDMHGLEIK